MNGWPHSSHSFLQLTVAEVLFYFFCFRGKVLVSLVIACSLIRTCF